MSYQPQYQYSYPARAPNHWLDLLLKVGGLLAGATAAAIMGAHLIHSYSPPSANAPVAQVIQYFGKGGLGAAGENSHWTMEASENTAQWRKAVRYCQARASAQDAGWSGAAPKVPAGCGVINTLAQSGY